MPEKLERSSRDMPSPWYLGFGILWSWIPVFGFTSFINPSTSHAAILEDLSSAAWILYCLFSAASLFLILRLRRRAIPFDKHPHLVSLSAFGLSLGTGICVLAGQGLLLPPFLCVGPIFMGLCSGVLMMATGEPLGLIGTRQASIVIVSSTVLVALVSLSRFALSAASHLMSTLVLVVLPLLCLVFIRQTWQLNTRQRKSIKVTVDEHVLPKRIIIGLLFTGMAVGLMLAFGADIAASNSLFPVLLVYSLGVLAGAAPLLALTLATSTPVDYGKLYRFVPVFVSLGLVLALLFRNHVSPEVIAGFIACGWGVQLIINVSTSADLANRMPAPGMVMFNQMSLAHTAGKTLGLLLWLLVGNPFDYYASDHYLPLAALMFIVILAAIVLLNESGKTTIWGLLPSHNEGNESAQAHTIASIAEQYGLTLREREVLLLLVRGYSAKAVSSSLTISLSTSRTHIHRIYTKLEVHSRQDVLDLIDRH